MNHLRKLILVAASLVIALAVTASAASAQETSIAVKTEAGGSCNPCVGHVAGEASVFAGATEISRCHIEATVRIYTSSGEAELSGSADGGPGCNTVNCSSPENHWPVSALGERSANVIHGTNRFCLSGNHCNAEVTATEPTTHRYAVSVNQTCPSGARVAGSATVEGNPVEIDHTP